MNRLSARFGEERNEPVETAATDPQDRLVEMITREPTRLMQRIGRLIHDDFVAEDLAQESLVRALRSITSLRGTDEGTVCKWLDRIAYNAALNYIRDEERRPGNVSLNTGEQPLADTLPAPEPEPAAAIVQAEVQDALLELIRALPTELSAVFLLRDVESLSTAETAGALGISEGLVKWRLHHARKQLRAQLRIDDAPKPA